MLPSISIDDDRFAEHGALMALQEVTLVLIPRTGEEHLAKQSGIWKGKGTTEIRQNRFFGNLERYGDPLGDPWDVRGSPKLSQ